MRYPQTIDLFIVPICGASITLGYQRIWEA
ncbi:hypothetical protein Brsp02_04394 [Brucella sp. NBRC 113783]